MKKFHGEGSQIKASAEVVEISSDEDEAKDSATDKYHVFIRTVCGKRFLIEAEPADTIKDVKTKIQSKEKIAVEHQKLLFNKVQLEDQRTLLESEIESGSTIDLDLSIRLSFIVAPTFKTIQLKVQRSDTAANVETKVMTQEGISKDKQRFFIYMGKVLEVHRTLDSYGISDGSTLHLVLREEPKTVESINLCNVI